MSTNPENASTAVTTAICPITMEPEDHECPECGHMIAESIFNEICESEGYTNNCRHCQAKEEKSGCRECGEEFCDEHRFCEYCDEMNEDCVVHEWGCQMMCPDCAEKNPCPKDMCKVCYPEEE